MEDTLVYPITCNGCGNTWIDDMEPEECPHCHCKDLIIDSMTLKELDDMCS